MRLSAAPEEAAKPAGDSITCAFVDFSVQEAVPWTSSDAPESPTSPRLPTVTVPAAWTVTLCPATVTAGSSVMYLIPPAPPAAMTFEPTTSAWSPCTLILSSVVPDSIQSPWIVNASVSTGCQ